MRPLFIAFFRVVVSMACLSVAAQAADLRIAVLKYGTVMWELDTIRHYELDQAQGFRLDIQGVAGGAAAKIAFQGGETDVIVTDWLWVARQRAAGKDYVFLPYSKAVGGLLVAPQSTAQDIRDLDGQKIGIAGGPLDKSWLILQAYAKAQYGFDLNTRSEQVFAAPPLIFKAALQGQVAGAINYWHYTKRMEAAGMRRLVDVETAARALGLNPETPLLGYVLRGELLREQPDLVRGLAVASRGAKDLLAQEEAPWDRLRNVMKVENDAQFAALKQGFRAGIPAEGAVDLDGVARMLAVMVEHGGPALLGPLKTLPDGVFVDLER